MKDDKLGSGTTEAFSGSLSSRSKCSTPEKSMERGSSSSTDEHFYGDISRTLLFFPQTINNVQTGFSPQTAAFSSRVMYPLFQAGQR
jgi:hypothetical protein